MLMLMLALTSVCKMSIKLRQLLRSFLEMILISTSILYQYSNISWKKCIFIVVTFPLLFLQLLRRYHLPLYFPFDCLNFSPRRNWMGSNLEHFHTKQAKLKHLYQKQTKLKQTFPEVFGSCRNAVKLFCKRFRVQLGQALWRRRRQEKAETFCWIESHKSLHNFPSGSYTGWFF